MADELVERSGSGSDALDLPEWMRPVVVVGALAALMWLVEVIDLVPGVDLDRWGLEPREVDGLVGIVTMPFLHGGFGHLISNTIPFVIMGALIAAGGLARYFTVTAIIAVVAGVGTWLVGPDGTVHIGASALVFGYLTYLLARGIFDRTSVERYRVERGSGRTRTWAPHCTCMLHPPAQHRWRSSMPWAEAGSPQAWSFPQQAAP